jgi:hypothetical protein
MGSDNGTPRTKTDAAAALSAWVTTDTVLGLRVWGTNIEVRFDRFDASLPFLNVGSRAGSEIHLDDPSVSRDHARIERVGPAFLVEDRDSKNGTYCNDERQGKFRLMPGTVVRFGSQRMVAFSERLQTMRASLQRFLGYGREAFEAVEEAQLAILRGHHLILLAPKRGGALALGRYVHRITCGAAWPCFDASTDPIPTVGAQTDYRPQKEYLARAAYGTIIARANELPKDRAFFLSELAARTYHVRLILIAAPSAKVEQLVSARLLESGTKILTVPPLSDRRAEMSRVIGDTVADLLARTGASAMPLRPEDYGRMEARRWPGNMDDLEDVAERLILIRRLGQHGAAKHLGRSPAAISLWVKKHGFKHYA